MAPILSFELGPDRNNIAGAGATTTVAVQSVTAGVVTSHGTFLSNPESGNDNIREWKAFSVALPAGWSAAAGDSIRFTYSAGASASYVRRVKVTDGTTEYRPEYPTGETYPPSLDDGIGLYPSVDFQGASGSSSAFRLNAVTLGLDSGSNPLEWTFGVTLPVIGSWAWIGLV